MFHECWKWSSCDIVCQALESEIVAHEPLMEAVSNMAQHMVTKKHPAVYEIESRLGNLRADLKQLKELTAARKLKLTDAVESQTVGWYAVLFQCS